MTDIGKELLNVPFPEMVVKLASAIAEGQMEMDKICCNIAKMMGDSKKVSIELPDLTKDDNSTIKTSLIGAGFQPTFYQFTDTIIEVKMAMSMTKSSEASISTKAGGNWGICSASVNASYTSKYSFEASGSSLLRTRITPVPPSTFVQKLLEIKGQMIQLEYQLKIKKVELEMQAEMAKIEKEVAKEAEKVAESKE
jgi:hypothetical protein